MTEDGHTLHIKGQGLHIQDRDSRRHILCAVLLVGQEFTAWHGAVCLKGTP